MKTKFNNSELTHIWANQTQTHGKGSNMFFEYDSIYSYGYHFKLAQHMINQNGQKCVLFNDKSYSNTTSKHQRLVWRSIPSNIHFFRVKTIFNNIETATNAHLENLNNYLDIAENAKSKALTATKLKNGFIQQAKASIGVFDNYKAFFSLHGLVFEYQTINKRYAEILEWLIDYQNSKEFKQWQIKQEENKKKAEIKAIEKAKESIEAFRQFKISSIYANLGHYLLRYNNETQMIETSGGVKMPRPLFVSAYKRLIRNELEQGQHIGSYVFNGIDGEIVTVGCHKIPMTEIQSVISCL